MNNEKGVTLIELLISVVIAGMVIVPLLLIMTGSFTRTVDQGEDTQLNYYGQQIMETIREKGYKSGISPTQYYCKDDQGCVASTLANYDAKVTITEKTVRYSAIDFTEITAKIVSKDSSSIELVTVVKKQ
ncbi:prepilin-type N-terminal cleavage/methylation domain-containing protein [Robertmurraya korlensis]|uniref:prepilin-type N-terminal cleavage/methylation domain-containing protein n=1 Tax=Robertmurraya korlensis TaxID=519977 RepID=UPI00203F35F4|nr:prepilin-type N-terminal cleavage/methylation domain-containing protein [Robertmurraya korlensis]MCM3603021.1 prepilin-type N-terminal cleavage/methylation domain-containing protein [Robertmurraya korlensis]